MSWRALARMSSHPTTAPAGRPRTKSPVASPTLLCSPASERPSTLLDVQERRNIVTPAAASDLSPRSCEETGWVVGTRFHVRRHTTDLSILLALSDPPVAQPLPDCKSQHEFGHQSHDPLSGKAERYHQEQSIAAQCPDSIHDDRNPSVGDSYFRPAGIEPQNRGVHDE